MPWTVQRYIQLAGAGTMWDPDPVATQPGETALDGASDPIPLVTSMSGTIWGDAIVVDDAGVTQPPGSFTVSLSFAKRTLADVEPAGGGTPTAQYAWNAGVSSADQVPGREQSQPGMESPAVAILVVTAGTNAPASGRLAIRIWEGER